jgi:hypothetical protein
MVVNATPDAISRIMREKSLWFSKDLHVVSDRNPIVNEHYLVVAKSLAHSFADSDCKQSLDMLFQGGGPFSNQRWILVERGRASFCTSKFGSSHAHAHLIPEEKFAKSVVDEFANQLEATRYYSLSEALGAARISHCEYFVARAPNGIAFLKLISQGTIIQKQLIRSFFSARTI